MMTRETKIGLGVACSFLCLLGVVLAGKYTTLFGTPPSADGEVQVASNENSEPPKKEPTTSDLGKKNPPSTTESLPTLQPVPSSPPVVQAGGTNLDELPPLPLVKKERSNSDPTVSEPIPVTRPKETNPTEEAPALPETSKTDKTDEKNPDDLPPLPATDESEKPGDADSKPQTKKEKSAPDTALTASDTKVGGETGAKLPPLPEKEPGKNINPAAEVSINLPPPPPLKKTVPESPTAAVSGAKTVPAMSLPVDKGPPKDPSDAGLPANTQVALDRPVPGNSGDSPRLAPRTREPLRSAGPIDGTPTSRVPARPASVSAPRVESFDEETCRPRQDDTFASISKRYYQSDKYAQALLLFNREHPRAAEGVRRDPPDLAGQAIYIPPIHILEKRHGNAIEGYTPPPSNPTPVGRETLRSVATPSSRPETANSTTYQVSPNGETMMEIARTKLGNGDRWREIQQINPGWRPDYPIPGGTTLRLPAEAR